MDQVSVAARYSLSVSSENASFSKRVFVFMDAKP